MNDSAVGGSDDEADLLERRLEQVLRYVSNLPERPVPSPAHCAKRASVAVIVAHFRPPSPSCTALPRRRRRRRRGLDGEDTLTGETRATEAQTERRAKVPHVLFIRRAARQGDRWSSHVALPGGRVELGESDVEAAIRETAEEVGLDIRPAMRRTSTGDPTTSSSSSTTDSDDGDVTGKWIGELVGSLGSRMVTSRLGGEDLLVLNPFLFILRQSSPLHHDDEDDDDDDDDGPPQTTPQESEVASCHWVPLAALLDERNDGIESVDVVARLVTPPSSSSSSSSSSSPSSDRNDDDGRRSWRGVWRDAVKVLVGWSVGEMIFPGTRLRPSHSTYADPHGLCRDQDQGADGRLHSAAGEEGDGDGDGDGEVLMMWGLTHAVMLDLLDLFRPSLSTSAADRGTELGTGRDGMRSRWWFPTFTRPDLRGVLWVLSVLSRNNVSALRIPRHTVRNIVSQDDDRDDRDETGVWMGRMDYVGIAMRRYYRLVRPAILLTTLFRLATVTWLMRRVVRSIRRGRG